ncbi:uncharacterized protein LOC102208505 [Pundamilia nyererei]|uniref:Uncharacterized protein LOC102208505 n=1 Tax=Pundamilia nyererei TaxID=303518 RepID=A0A9Y3VYI2_9CICH|nr:PREDICTED: uncharacterized protein LOC102208505 [Pundamilia nyererei]
MDVLPCMMLVFLLSVGASLAQVDLTPIVRKIRGQYSIDGQFCLAAVLPVDLNLNTLNQVFQDDPFQAVLGNIGERTSDNNNRGVYVGQRVIVARPTSPEGGQSGQHAESRVLQTLRERLETENLNTFPNSQDNFLLIYSFASACDTCTNRYHSSSIIEDLELIAETYYSVFVFKKIFQPNNRPPIPENILVNSLRSLGDAIGGLTNIFRCDPNCYSCSGGQTNTISQYCIVNNA